jgi:hypothetical protein
MQHAGHAEILHVGETSHHFVRDIGSGGEKAGCGGNSGHGDDAERPHDEPLRGIAKRRFPDDAVVGRAAQSASAGAVEEVARVVARLRARWPRTRILLRADSGFAREGLMARCEANGIDFLFGLAQNERLIAEIKTELEPSSSPNTKENGQISPSNTTRTVWNCREPPTLSHLGFQPVQKTPTIHGSPGFTWGMPVYDVQRCFFV